MSLNSGRAWEFIASDEIEGGGKIHNVAGDPGGVTKWGFAQRFNPDIDVTTLTEEQAYQRFLARYWDKYQCENLPFPMALALVDYVFNADPIKAVAAFQRGVGAEPDGIMGPATTARALSEYKLRGLKAVVEVLGWRCVNYAQGNPKFRRGWFNRTFLLLLEVSK